MALGRRPIEIVESGTYQLLMKSESWGRVWLHQVAEVRNGYAFQSKFFSHDSGLPLIRIRDIAKIETENLYSGKLENEFLVKTGDILIGMDGDFKCARWPGNIGLLNQRVCKIIPRTELYLEKFLYLCLQPYLNAINQETSSITVKHLSSRTIEDIPLPLPPLNEQHRIVTKIEELFSELDKGVESLKTAREQLKVYRQALLKHAFEGKLTEEWRKENADKLETAGQILKSIIPVQQPKGGRAATKDKIEGVAGLAVNTPSKPAPDGWAWVPLLNIARQETGHTPSRNHPEYWENGNISWIGISDARTHHGSVINETNQKITQLGLENSSARLLPEGTVCLSRTASVGYVCIMGKDMATSQDFATWSCSELLSPLFLMYALLAEGEEIKRFGRGTTHTTIYFPEIRAINICLPSKAEQKVIVEKLEKALTSVENTVDEIEKQIAKSEVLRQSILKKAFSGQLVPQDPNDEPASVLLERIAREKAETAATPRKSRAAKAAHNV